MNGHIEIRTNEDESLDEVIGQNCQFHLEQMSDKHWWMAVEVGGKRIDVNLHSKATITAMVSDES